MTTENLTYEHGVIEGHNVPFWRVRGDNGVIELLQFNPSEDPTAGVIGLHSRAPMHAEDVRAPCDHFEDGCFSDVTFRNATRLLEYVLDGGDPRQELSEWYERLAGPVTP